MSTNSAWGVISGLGLCVGLLSGACDDARSTARGSRAGDAGATVPNPEPRQAGSTGSSLAPDAGPPPSVDSAARVPVSNAELPEGVTRVAVERVPAALLRHAVQANNEFGVALFYALREDSAGRNFLISPISASLALGMTYAGARRETQTEMARALRLTSQPAERSFQGQNALSQTLAKRGALAFDVAQANFHRPSAPPAAADFSLEIANSLWGQAGYHFQAPFLRTLAANYGAGLFKRDFVRSSEPTRLEINRWVRAHTNDKINDVLPQGAVTPDTRLLLVNALHLKLPWETPFAESATEAALFQCLNVKEVPIAMSVPFMRRTDRLAYHDDGSAQIVALPLVSRHMWLVVALPHPGVSLANYERSLRAGSPALVVPSAEQLVALSLPKVTFFSPSISLDHALQRLGMVRAFDPGRAQFEGMYQRERGEQPLYVGSVQQKTTIAMQESGIEAAAATAVSMVAASARLPQKEPVPIPMIVNRPYVFAIVDQPTGALLLLGHIELPKDLPETPNLAPAGQE